MPNQRIAVGAESLVERQPIGFAETCSRDGQQLALLDGHVAEVSVDLEQHRPQHAEVGWMLFAMGLGHQQAY